MSIVPSQDVIEIQQLREQITYLQTVSTQQVMKIRQLEIQLEQLAGQITVDGEM